jgi:hypothetical protein
LVTSGFYDEDGVLSEITGNLNAERFTFQQPAGSPSTTRRFAWTTTCVRSYADGTYYRQKFTDTSFDTTNSREPTLPGFPLYGTQGRSVRPTPDVPIDAQPEHRERIQGRLLGAPVNFGPYHNPGMYSGPLANQGGFALGINAASGITNAGPAFTPSARNATTLTVADTVNWLKGSHSIGLGGEFGQYDVWLATSARRPCRPSRSARRPATRRLGCSPPRTSRAAARATATRPPRSTQCSWTRDHIGATARLDGGSGQYVYQGDSRAEGRLRQFDFFIQDNWRAKPNLSVNLGVRYALQMPFSAQNASYSTATLDSLWGVSGYVPGCDLSNPTPETCHLFTPGTMTGKKPEYINLGKGVQAYEMDANNIAPSIGVNWTPKASSGFFRTLLGASGTSSLSAGYSRAFDRRGMNDFTGVFGNNPGLSITGRGTRLPATSRCHCFSATATSDRRRPARRSRPSNRPAVCWPRRSTR